MTSHCPRCESGVGRHVPTTRKPSVRQLEEWDGDGGCETTDGCWTEPDGKCEHGHSSWLIVMGLI